MKRRWLLAAAGSVLVLCGAGVAVWQWAPDRPPLPPEVTPRRYELAAEQFRRHYDREPEHFDVLTWLGDAALQDGAPRTALACFEQIPSSHPRYGAAARRQQGRALLRLDRAVAAEQQFQEFLRLAEGKENIPASMVADARDKLRYLYEVELRFEERRRVLEANIRAGYFDKLDLLKYCFPSLLRWNGPQAVAWLEDFHAENPQSFRLRVALGRYRTGQGRLEEAQRILEKCCREHPQDPAARAALLECLREQGQWAQMAAIVEKLPPPQASDPWLLLRLRGHVNNHLGRPREAARCFRLVLQSDPASAESCLGLARAYAALDKTQQRQQLLEKAQVLARIQNRTGRIQGTDDVEAFLEVAELCEQIGLHEFALLWARHARSTHPEHRQAQRLLARLRNGTSASPSSSTPSPSTPAR